LRPLRGWLRRNFVKMFDAGKTRMTGLPYGEKKLWWYVKPFSSDTGTSRTDRTDRQTIAISVCWRVIKADTLSLVRNCASVQSKVIVKIIVKIVTIWKSADLFELTKVFVFAEAFEVRHCLGVVEAVLVVDFSVASQLTKLTHTHTHTVGFRLDKTRRMALANGTCVSFCNQPKAQFGYLRRVTPVCRCRFAGKSLDLRKLESWGYQAVKTVWR